jgi:Recombinase zinc beta ribbon domain
VSPGWAVVPGWLDMEPNNVNRRRQHRARDTSSTSTSALPGEVDAADLTALARALLAAALAVHARPAGCQALVSPELFQRVQDRLAARSARGIRERKHHHYLKGVLHCAVCGRRYSFLVATGKSGRRYPYFYCLGTRPAGRGGCREPHLPADRLERQVEQLYERIQLPHHWLTELQAALEAEIAIRQGQAAHELQQLDHELLGLDGERRKLLEAYYATSSTSNCSARNRPESANGPAPWRPAAAPLP